MTPEERARSIVVDVYKHIVLHDGSSVVVEDVAAATTVLASLRAAISAEREACAALADKAFERNDRLADQHVAMPADEYTDVRAKGEIVATFAHIAHEAHDIAAAIRARE